ncbi:MAG TPA: thiamine phosphate synthase [Opitutaceae bacterium]|jgi:thiamine-phosphate pyrophosphorylase|nr:thiamine phosphate synthase [Opitutaceae bacterium]
MKLVVISPERDDPREIAVMGALFAAGLERYHVRKPHWPAAKLGAWLHALPAEWHSRLVLHSHHEFVAERRLGGDKCASLGGRHWRDDGLAPFMPPEGEGLTSRSCHDLVALRTALGSYDSVFFGPVFPSLSKSGHGPRGDFSVDKLSILLAQRTSIERRTAVLALGGVRVERLSRCRELGFDGVAVLGAVWQSDDPARAFAGLQEALCCHVA